jgi:hypothetical protein
LKPRKTKTKKIKVSNGREKTKKKESANIFARELVKQCGDE